MWRRTGRKRGIGARAFSLNSWILIVIEKPPPFLGSQSTPASVGTTITPFIVTVLMLGILLRKVSRASAENSACTLNSLSETSLGIPFSTRVICTAWQLGFLSFLVSRVSAYFFSQGRRVRDMSGKYGVSSTRQRSVRFLSIFKASRLPILTR